MEKEYFTNLSNKQILNLASKVAVASEVPSNGDRGAHSLRVSLKRSE